MSSDDDDEHMKRYSVLNRSKKRKMIVNILSSDSEEKSEEETKKKNPKRKVKKIKTIPIKNGSKIQLNSDIIEIDDGSSDSCGYLSEDDPRISEIRKKKTERIIAKRLAEDKVLNQTQAIISKVMATKSILIPTSDGEKSEDEAIFISSPKSQNGMNRPDEETQTNANIDKGERLQLKLRVNGSETPEIFLIYAKSPFEELYDKFCSVHCVPPSAVQMSLDGEVINEQDTAFANDLESGDIIEVKVDYTKQDLAKKNKRDSLVRLRLTTGKIRSEIFLIGKTTPLIKLRATYCNKHGIRDPDDVKMSVAGVQLILSKTSEDYNLMNQDEVDVEVAEEVNPDAVNLQFRYPNGSKITHRFLLNTTIASVMEKLSQESSEITGQLKLKIDGEVMQPSQTLQSYDLEGEELIDIIT